jgi:flagellum-specific peptidoglycan hydrolase FlgJ
MPQGINFGILQPTQQAQVQVTQNPQQGAGGQGGAGGGLGGLLSGIGSAFKSLKADFGPNPASTANAAVTSTMQSGSTQELASSILGSSYQNPQPGSNQPGQPSQGMQQQAKQAVQGNPSASGATSQGTPSLGIPQISQAATQAFPNNPVMQQLAVSQAAQESGLTSGKPSGLATHGNNLFGMKGVGDAGSISMPTTEYVNGKPTTVNAQFAKYSSPQASMAAYAKTMNNPRYNDVVNAPDFETAANNVQKAGYATDPNYAKSLMGIHNQLNQTHTETPATAAIKTDAQAYKEPPANAQGSTPIPVAMEQSPAFKSTMTGYAAARQAGVTKSPFVASVDFTQPESAKRLTIMNAETGKIVMQTYAGQGAPGFSNTPGSHQSSTGTFLTQQVNTDSKEPGGALKITGLDKGVNDNAASRDIELHGADYVGPGKSGRSFGCFTVPSADAPKVINLLKGGAIVNAYAGDTGQVSSQAYKNYDSIRQAQTNTQQPGQAGGQGQAPQSQQMAQNTGGGILGKPGQAGGQKGKGSTYNSSGNEFNLLKAQFGGINSKA